MTRWLAKLLSRRSLALLLLLNVAASIAHYTDNVLFFSTYPEPTWLDPTRVDLAWFAVTPFAAAGYLFYRRGQTRLALGVLAAYAGMGLLVLGHYRYADFCSIALRIHAFILLEAAAAACLLGWILLRFGNRRFAPFGDEA